MMISNYETFDFSASFKGVDFTEAMEQYRLSAWDTDDASANVCGKLLSYVIPHKYLPNMVLVLGVTDGVVSDYIVMVYELTEKERAEIRANLKEKEKEAKQELYKAIALHNDRPTLWRQYEDARHEYINIQSALRNL